MNRDFYEEYENGLTAKVHLMRWLFGIAMLLPFAIIVMALVFGGKVAALVIFGLFAGLVFPYIVGGMFYDMKMMNKHGVVYK